ncbi:MAG: isoaspartyl peptidase/L-asparaginase [Anaerolineae bacterium]|nr:isoaspartyl peptidase/L-asparaginase [Anaerolineae bacterium]
MRAAIIVHGGAWDIPAAEHAAHQSGCRLAVLAGYQILAAGGSALEAVEAAVMLLEDDPTFDAGIGSHLNQAGVVQLDAGLMEGTTWQVGAVAAVERLRHPIQVARLLLTSPHNMFVGEGAEQWAVGRGVPLVERDSFIVPREQARYERFRQRAEPAPAARQPDGTVGAVAIDRSGQLVAGTSTGGTLFKPVGRVGDSPLPGCGYYADNGSAAVSSTGHGESIIRVQLAHSAALFAAGLADDGQPVCHTAAAAAIARLHERVAGQGGLIMIDRFGRVGFAYNTPNLAYAFMREGMVEPAVGI